MFGPFASAGEIQPGFCPRCNTWLVPELEGKAVKLRPPEKPNTRKESACSHCGAEWELWVTRDGMLSKIYGATVQSVGGAPDVSCNKCGGWSHYTP
jgi:hypothetical protein